MKKVILAVALLLISNVIVSCQSPEYQKTPENAKEYMSQTGSNEVKSSITGVTNQASAGVVSLSGTTSSVIDVEVSEIQFQVPSDFSVSKYQKDAVVTISGIKKDGMNQYGLTAYEENASFNTFEAYYEDMKSGFIKKLIKENNPNFNNAEVSVELEKLKGHYSFETKEINGLYAVLHKRDFYGMIGKIFDMYVYLGNGKILHFSSESDYPEITERIYLSIRKTTTGSALDFSDSQIKDILVKINESSRDESIHEILAGRGNTRSFVQGEYQAEYNNDLIRTTVHGESHSFKSLKGEFLGFFGFSPSGNYLYYLSNDSQEYGPAIYYNIVEATSGRPIFILGGHEESAGLFAWTQDRKRFIFSRKGLVNSSIEITVKGKFPTTTNIDTGEYFAVNGYADNDFLYSKGKMYNSDLGKEINFLKIYNLGTLNEVFSKEISE